VKAPSPFPAVGVGVIGMLAVLCCAGPVLVANVGFAGVLTLLRTPPSLIVAAILALIVATAIVKRSPRTVYNGQQKK